MLDKRIKMWYTKLREAMVFLIRFTIKQKAKGCDLWLSLCADCLLMLTVFSLLQPLAYVVCDYTCSDRDYKSYEIFHFRFTSFQLERNRQQVNYIIKRE